MSRVIQIVQRVLLTLCAFLLSLLICEGGARLLGRPILSSEWRLHADWMSLDADVIQVHERFLDDDFYVFAPATELKVVALGDSFTEGACLWSEPEAMYPTLLERQLRDAGVKAAVMNAGMTDSGPDQELRLFKRFILPKVTPDVVVWQFYQNDLYDNIIHAVYTDSDTQRLVPLNAAENWTSVRQRLHDDFPLPEIIKSRSYVFQHLLRLTELTRAAAVPEAHRADPNRWSLRKIELAVEEMNELASTHGFLAFYALVAPQSMYLSSAGDYYGSQMHRLLYDVLSTQERFIEIRVTAPDLKGQGVEIEGAEPSDIAAVVFCDEERDGNTLGDRHFAEIGHDVFATKVAERIMTGL